MTNVVYFEIDPLDYPPVSLYLPEDVVISLVDDTPIAGSLLSFYQPSGWHQKVVHHWDSNEVNHMQTVGQSPPILEEYFDLVPFARFFVMPPSITNSIHDRVLYMAQYMWTDDMITMLLNKIPSAQVQFAW